MGIHLNASFSLAAPIAALALFNGGGAIAQTQQEHVHDMSHGVMPFDMKRTVHVFKMSESGGIQRVVVRDRSDAGQITGRFQRGDYSDPANLHGATMPGLIELQQGAERVRVTYSDLPDGAEIIFETLDVHMLTAIHRWFGAQLSEHGADAKAE